MTQASKKRIKKVADDSKAGRCYELAFKAMNNHPNCRLVHAVVTGQGPIHGVRYGHAWIEYENEHGFIIAIDLTVGIEIAAEVYRMIGQASDAVEYTLKEACEKAVEFGHYGPWDQVISSAAHAK